MPSTPAKTPDPSTGAIMTPIYATSTYVQQSPGVHKGFEYSRSQNPTRFAYERCVADLEGGARGFAFASGLAAMATILDLLNTGDPCVASDDLYGGTFRLFERVRKRSAGLEFSFIDMSEPEAVERALRPNTRMVWVETPSNPLLKIIDLEAVAAIAKERHLLAVADNTFASPYLQRPLEIGFDIVVHSATKYLNGHSDIVGGVVVVSDPDLGERLAFLQNAVGAIAGPFDSFLVLRGLKTLHLRMEQSLCECARAGRMAHAASRRRTRHISRPRLASTARARTPPNGRLWRYGIACFEKRSFVHSQSARALPRLCSGRESWWRRKLDRASGHHDPRFRTR